jgi:hypothetical protein
MNNQLNQYPAALYSAVPEFGYRTERFTGEVLRSGQARTGARRPSLLSRLRHLMDRDGSGRGGRQVVVYPMHEAR